MMLTPEQEDRLYLIGVELRCAEGMVAGRPGRGTLSNYDATRLRAWADRVMAAAQVAQEFAAEIERTEQEGETPGPGERLKQ